MDAPDFDEDEAFDRALRVEPEVGDAERLWEWWAAVCGGKATTVTEDVRRAGQRIGFAFDRFAPVLAEATRLERFLDAMRGGV